jgi:CheY-like chemotaxis protein
MPTGQKTIIFVDDEPFYVRPYISRLNDAGFKVEAYETVNAALERLTSNGGADVDALVIDMTFSAPDESRRPEWFGGLTLLKHLFEKSLVSKKLPVIILSNRYAESVSNECRKLDVPYDDFYVCRKSEWSPTAFTELVKSSVVSNDERRKKE